MALERFSALREAWGVQSPRSGGTVRPKGGPRKEGITMPKPPGPTVSAVAPGTATRKTANYGGDNTVTRPPTPATPPQAKIVRVPVKRWNGTTKRPQMGGAIRRRSVTEAVLRVLEYNPYHGAGGKFSSKGNAKVTVAYGGKAPKGGVKAAVAMAAARTAAGGGSRRLAQDAAAHRKGKSYGDAAAQAFKGARAAKQAGNADAAKRLKAKGLALRGLRGAQGGPTASRTRGVDSDRIQVPQKLDKYTKGNYSGRAPKGGAKEAIARRKAADAAGGPSPLLAQDDRGRRPAAGQKMNKTQAHAQAAQSYGNARRGKQDGSDRSYVKDSLRSAAAAGKVGRSLGAAAGSRPAIVNVGPGSNPRVAAAAMTAAAGRMAARGDTAGAAWTKKAAGAIKARAGAAGGGKYVQVPQKLDKYVSGPAGAGKKLKGGKLRDARNMRRGGIEDQKFGGSARLAQGGAKGEAGQRHQMASEQFASARRQIAKGKAMAKAGGDGGRGMENIVGGRYTRDLAKEHVAAIKRRGKG